MMKITKKELIEMGACEDGLARFIEQTNNTEEPVEVTSLIGGKNTFNDLLWLAGKKLPKEKIVRFACDCALINIETIKPYTNVYYAIVDFLNKPTAAAARYAANTCYAACKDICYAACEDAYYAARAAYYAARAANYAAADAARAAYYAAEECEDKINTLLVKLFTGEVK